MWSLKKDRLGYKLKSLLFLTICPWGMCLNVSKLPIHYLQSGDDKMNLMVLLRGSNARKTLAVVSVQ